MILAKKTEEEEPQKQDHFLIWNQPEKTKKTDTVHVIYNKKNVICPALSSQVYAMKKMANKVWISLQTQEHCDEKSFSLSEEENQTK